MPKVDILVTVIVILLSIIKVSWIFVYKLFTLWYILKQKSFNKKQIKLKPKRKILCYNYLATEMLTIKEKINFLHDMIIDNVSPNI